MTKQKTNSTFDNIAMAAAVAMPLMTIPQLASVLKGHVEGVSLLTWSLYTLVSLVFAIMGYKRRDKTLIVAYVPMFLLEVGIVGGLLVVHTK